MGHTKLKCNGYKTRQIPVVLALTVRNEQELLIEPGSCNTGNVPS